jgi:hypothetical protein
MAQEAHRSPLPSRRYFAGDLEAKEKIKSLPRRFCKGFGSRGFGEVATYLAWIGSREKTRRLKRQGQGQNCPLNLEKNENKRFRINI